MRIPFLLAAFVLPLTASAAPLFPLSPDAAPDARATAFPLVAEGRAAALVLPADAPEVVRIAARDFAADVERVSGVRPVVEETPPANDAPRVEIALAPDLAGRWEAFRLSATPGILRVEGSDPRALAYGLYELSRRIGVSPWHWWADVPVAHRSELRLEAGVEPVDAPAVRHRGLFLNDEDWGLQPWAAKTFEPGAGTIGPKTYARLFELMLRLRANTLWPAMHGCTLPFHRVPGNNAVADDYAIILGSSHAEPMLRNNIGEWTAPKDDYNYLTHRDDVLAYWEQRVRERAAGESLFTLGMRGIHDSPIVGPKTRAERIATLERIFADQRALLARHLGDGDATRVRQIFVPYKEVLDDYDAGLRVPPDVTLVWPDDNFGYIRRFATPAERARPGGLGVYYHLSYLGAPMAWLWFDSLPPALVWSELTRAYEQGARTVWIANVGDLKANEQSTEFFLDLAWHADRTSPEAPSRFLHAMAARDFGPARADAIADVWARHQALAFARKPEHLQWHLPLTAYAPTALTGAEIHRRLDAYAALVRDTAAIAAALPAEAQDAFFELVGHPVEAAAAANERYFRAELARRQKARGEPAAAETFALSEHAARRIDELTTRYNERIAGGKWRHILGVNGLSPRDWPRFQPGSPPPLDSPEALAAVPPEPAPASPVVAPSDARPGDFFEHDGVVSLHAGHFTERSDAPGGGWCSVAGLGRTGTAVTVLPSTLVFAPDAAPRLSYRFHVATGGPAVVHVRLLPTHPLVAGRGLRLALALDDGPPLAAAVTSGFDPKSDAWQQRVLANATELAVKLSAPLAPGWHDLHLVAIDSGVVVDKLVLDLGGLRPSYDGPPETRVSRDQAEERSPSTAMTATLDRLKANRIFSNLSDLERIESLPDWARDPAKAETFHIRPPSIASDRFTYAITLGPAGEVIIRRSGGLTDAREYFRLPNAAMETNRDQ